MALSIPVCNEIMRQRFGWSDDSMAPRVIAQIPASLKAFARKAASDPFTRSLVTSSVSTATLAITSTGSVDLSTGYSSYYFLMEYFDLGQCYLLPSATCGVSFPSSSSFTVTGAGTSGINGIYLFQGYYNGRVSYLNDVYALRWLDDGWYFQQVDGGYTILYRSDEDVNVPSLVTTWIRVEGAEGLPTVPAPTNPITISADLGVKDLDRVQFTTTVTLPTGISALTNYYIVGYTINENTNTASFQLSTTVTGAATVSVTSGGTGVLTMTKMDSSGVPLRKVNIQTAPLNQYLANVFNSFYIQGNTMQLLRVNGSYPAGTIAFSVPVYPSAVTSVPVELEAQYLDKLYELILADGNDTAQDLDK